MASAAGQERRPAQEAAALAAASVGVPAVLAAKSRKNGRGRVWTAAPVGVSAVPGAQPKMRPAQEAAALAAASADVPAVPAAQSRKIGRRRVWAAV